MQIFGCVFCVRLAWLEPDQCVPSNNLTLRDVDYRLRAMGMGSIWQAPNGRAEVIRQRHDPKSVRSLTPGDALKVLMQGAMSPKLPGTTATTTCMPSG